MKAVTDTKYYNEIAKKLQLYGSSDGVTPSQMADKIETVVHEREDWGRQEQLIEFWGPFQNYGEKMDYYASFRHRGWANENAYNPQFTMNASTFNGVFSSSSVVDAKVPIDVTDGDLTEAFRYGAIQRIPKLIVNENTTYSYPFRYASSLRELYVEGVIASSDFDLSYTSSLFTPESMISVITALKNYAGTCVGIR